jgi:kynurenine formamidase
MGREAPVFRIVPGVIMTRSQRPDQLIDISILVNEFTPEWPGDTPFSCQWTWEMARGESVNVSCINSSPHVGTHADAPFHVDPRWPTSEALPLEAFSGPVTVVDVTNHHDGIVRRRRHTTGRTPPVAHGSNRRRWAVSGRVALAR